MTLQIRDGYPTEQDVDTADAPFVFREPSGTYGWAAPGAISYGYVSAEEAWKYAQLGEISERGKRAQP